MTLPGMCYWHGMHDWSNAWVYIRLIDNAQARRLLSITMRNVEQDEQELMVICLLAGSLSTMPTILLAY